MESISGGFFFSSPFIACIDLSPHSSMEPEQWHLSKTSNKHQGGHFHHEGPPPESAKRQFLGVPSHQSNKTNLSISFSPAGRENAYLRSGREWYLLVLRR